MRKQLELWKDLILAYSERHRIFEVDLGKVETTVPFVNSAISRMLYNYTFFIFGFR